MYYATGVPGWMRFGYSPGWGGMPPGAEFMMSGQWPTPEAQAAWEAMQQGQGQGQGPMPPAGPVGPGPMWGGYAPSPEQQVQFLSDQLAMIAEHLGMITEQIGALNDAQE